MTQKQNEIWASVRQVLREVGSTTEKVAVEIDGRVFYMTEREIRALQILAFRASKQSKETFDEFNKTVIIYKGRAKGQPRKAGYDIVKLRTDGRLEEPFFPGFFEINDKLSLLLLEEHIK